LILWIFPLVFGGFYCVTSIVERLQVIEDESKCWVHHDRDDVIHHCRRCHSAILNTSLAKILVAPKSLEANSLPLAIVPALVSASAPAIDFLLRGLGVIGAEP
jgi:hypothetical protein